MKLSLEVWKKSNLILEGTKEDYKLHREERRGKTRLTERKAVILAGKFFFYPIIGSTLKRNE